MVKLTSFLRMWNKICLSYDFGENEARVAFSGEVSDLIRDPVTKPNMQGITFSLYFDKSLISGRFDGGLLDRRGGATPVKIILGRYQFDKNPLIGSLAGINAWNR